MKTKNKVLLYTTTKVIESFKNNFPGEMRKIHLYKMMYLLKLDLEKIGIATKMPYYWYKYGPLLDVNTFYHETKVPFYEFSPMGSHFVNKPTNPAEMTLPKKEMESIDETIDLLINQINQKLDFIPKSLDDPLTEVLLATTYETAPYEFQPVFRKFKNSLKNEYYGHPMHLFKSLTKLFPEDDFENILDLYLEWETVVDIALDMNDLKFIEQLNTPFWEAFCYQMAPIKNENLMQSTINSRIEDIVIEIPLKKETLYKLSSFFYKNLKENSPQSIEDVNKYYKILRENDF